MTTGRALRGATSELSTAIASSRMVVIDRCVPRSTVWLAPLLIFSTFMMEIEAVHLAGVVGGAGADWNAIKAKAAPHCPATVAKYGDMDPSKVTRPLAERMGNECLAEMGPFKAGFARGTIHDAIDKAFPKPK